MNSVCNDGTCLIKSGIDGTGEVDSITHAMPRHLVNGNLLNYVWINEINTLTPIEVHSIVHRVDYSGFPLNVSDWAQIYRRRQVMTLIIERVILKPSVLTWCTQNCFLLIFRANLEYLMMTMPTSMGERGNASSVCTKIWIFNKTNFCQAVEVCVCWSSRVNEQFQSFLSRRIMFLFHTTPVVVLAINFRKMYCLDSFISPKPIEGTIFQPNGLSAPRVSFFPWPKLVATVFRTRIHFIRHGSGSFISPEQTLNSFGPGMLSKRKKNRRRTDSDDAVYVICFGS